MGQFLYVLKVLTREPVTERLTKTVWVRLPTSLRLLGRSDLFRDTNVRVSKSRKVRKTLLVHSRLELMSTGLESYQDRPLYQLSYPNLVFFKISELCRAGIYHKKYLTVYYFWYLGCLCFLRVQPKWFATPLEVSIMGETITISLMHFPEIFSSCGGDLDHIVCYRFLASDQRHIICELLSTWSVCFCNHFATPSSIMVWWPRDTGGPQIVRIFELKRSNIPL